MVQAMEEMTLSLPCYISVFLSCAWGNDPFQITGLNLSYIVESIY